MPGAHRNLRRARWNWGAATVLAAAALAAVAAHGVAGADAAAQPGQPALPASLQAEIAANDAAGLPGLDNGVTVPAGCDISTSLAPDGRPRIEQERTQHRLLNQGQSAAFIAAGNAQLEAYLQVAVRDYCASDNPGGPGAATPASPSPSPSPSASLPAPASGSPSPGASDPAAGQPALPASLQAEIAANDAAGLPGLDNGVTVPAGCDISTSLAPDGRPRIEQERTQHRLLNQGQSAAFIAAGNAQLEAYLQVAVRDYCANG